MSKLTAVAALALIAAFLAPGQSGAQNSTSSLVSESATTSTRAAGKKAAKKNGKKAALKAAGNANCPVSGHPVGSMQPGSHVVYKGYKVGLCCDSCKERFMGDADANLQKALNEKKQ